MAFQTIPFLLLFLPLAILIAWFCRRFAGGVLWQPAMILLSLAFYLEGDASHLPWLLASLAFNYFIASHIRPEEPDSVRKTWAFRGVAINLLFLCWFKYAGVLKYVGAASTFNWASFLPGFPLGVSFFTLQQIMYLMDRYEGIGPQATLREHLIFISWFPSVTAGPITRGRDMIPQLARPRDPSAEDLARGLVRFSLGLFQKVMIANSLSHLTDPAWLNPGGLRPGAAWMVVFAYTFQIYFDFNGYSDMAIGLSRALGVTLPENFRNPLASRSISEFWQRWHITLSNLIMTYVYTPLVRSRGRVTVTRSAAAAFVTMLLAGAWHGSGWTFVVFGAMHGAGLAAYQFWRARRLRMPDQAGRACTFLWVSLAFVFFRAPDLSAAFGMLRSLIDFTPSKLPDSLSQASPRAVMIFFLLLSAGIAAWWKSTGPFSESLRFRSVTALTIAAVFVLSFFCANDVTSIPFIYAAF